MPVTGHQRAVKNLQRVSKINQGELRKMQCTIIKRTMKSTAVLLVPLSLACPLSEPLSAKEISLARGQQQIQLAVRSETGFRTDKEQKQHKETDQKQQKIPYHKWKFNGCRSVEAIVYQNWPCHPSPAADPEGCKAGKQEQLENGICRASLELVKDELKPTGKSRGLFFHQKFSGYVRSGPFVELQDKAGNLWWVMQFDWFYANQKPAGK